MASYYVWSGASGSANGTSWANAYTTLALSFASGKVAGDVFYVAHDHAESTAGAIVLAPPSSVASPTKIICVNRSGSVPPVSADLRTTAQVTSTPNNSLSFQATAAHYDGIIFTSGSTTSNASIQVSVGGASRYTRLDNCSLRIGGSGTTGVIEIGLNSNIVGGFFVELNNTTVSFANAAQMISIQGAALKWRSTPSALLGTIPTTLFQPNAGRGGSIECIGVDFSAAGSGKTLIGAHATTYPIPVKFLDCKLDAAVTKATVPAAFGTTEIDFVRASATGNVAAYSHRYSGVLTEETSIVRSGGADDGTTPISWKVVTTANCSYSMPFEAPPIAIWNDTTGSAVTATVEGVLLGSSLPLDDEVWLEIEYISDASAPQGAFNSEGKANLLTTAATQTTSTATWPTVVPSATPATILTGVLGWWDASYTAGLTLSGSDINSVADRSGAGNTMNWVNGKPQYSATGYDSKPAFMFNTTNTSLQVDPFPMGTGNTITIWTMCTLSSNATSWIRLLSYAALGTTSDNNNTGSWNLSRQSSTTTSLYFERASAGALASSTAHPALHRVIVSMDSGGAVTIYIDGAVAATATRSGNWVSAGRLRFGAAADGTTGWAGPVAEAGVATGYSNAATVAQLDAYMTTKGLTDQKFKLACSFTAQQKGWVYARVKCAKPSSTFYIDPLVTLT